MGHIVGLFSDGKMQQLQTDVISMVQDPRYRFFDFEGEFLKAGMDLLGKNNTAAIAVFEMTSQMYPQSAKVWSALGDAYSMVGDLSKAKGFFEKALSIEPNGVLAKHATIRLKELGEH
jgi:tetratricopeptide (TPR) repeat protein